MSLDPIFTTQKISADYLSYLESMFFFEDKNLQNQAVKNLHRAGKFIKGPYIELTPPFMTGKSLDQLIGEGILSKKFEKIRDKFNYDLYIHQEESIRKISSGRNVIVATGTGSGKTECFLLPIIDSLLREKNLDPGIRALLLYPMNALANDQIDRLREILRKYPEITFGRYIGQTKDTRNQALEMFLQTHEESDLIPNELLSREEMRETPPHILLTNYAMLEYLLIRPEDHVFFDSAKSWRFIVLDEAHTYNGARGTEISMLLQRLKQRINSKNLTCIATSATLGDGEHVLDEVAEFAANLFHEKFEPSDIIQTQRIDLTSRTENPDVRRIQQTLQSKIQPLDEVAQKCFPKDPDPKRRVVDLISKFPEDLPARYHVFVRSLEGAFVSLYPSKNLYLERQKTVRFENDPTKSIVTFELANCQRCGQEYLVGREDGSTLKHCDADPNEGNTRQKFSYFLLRNDEIEVNNETFDDDSIALSNSKSIPEQKVETLYLCRACGYIGKKKGNCCDFPADKFVRIQKIKSKTPVENSCLICGAHSSGGIIRRFMTNDDASTDLLTRSLYPCIPENEKSKFGHGRKLLVFSDNRQEAAFFAPYLQRRYDTIQWRRAILKSIESLREDFPDYKIRLKNLTNALLKYSDEDHDLDFVQAMLMKEFLAFEPRIGLEGLGLISFRPMKIENLNPFPTEIDLTREECQELFTVMLDSIRQSRAVEFLPNANPKDEIFAPMNQEISFKSEADSSYLIGWSPKKDRNNRRLDFIRRLYERHGVSNPEEKSRVLLKKLFDILKLSEYVSKTNQRSGTEYKLKSEMWQVEIPSKIFRCDKCGVLTTRNVRGVCPTYRCSGNLKEYHDESTRFSHLKKLYENLNQDAISMKVHEHTAQLTSEFAARIQQEFVDGKINILSCSTTFEMGVDVGQLEAILMRNVPPTVSNYIQRAGRAGRRSESTAFVLTYCKRRMHDLNFFQHPEEIIAGKIKAPYIELSNEKIILRHVFSIVFAWFFKKYPERFKTANSLLDLESDGRASIKILDELLEDRPDEILKAIDYVVPKIPSVREFIGIESWKWIEYLLGESNGALVLAANKIKEIYDKLEEMRLESFKKRQSTGSIERTQKTYLGMQTLNFLSINNVIPRYGFPVDVVELDVRGNSEPSKNIELQRSLQLAISEFAPGNEVIANGQVWKPYALQINRAKNWTVKEYAICKECGRLYTEDSVLGVKSDKKVLNCCGKILEYQYAVQPIFGFTVKNDEPPGRVGDRRKPKPAPSRVKFYDYDNKNRALVESREESIPIGKFFVNLKYSSRGKLMVINDNRNRGYRLCAACGYIDLPSDKKNQKNEHETHFGYKCSNTYLHHVHLGHEFITDVVEIKFPTFDSKFHGRKFWTSLLYALIAGAAESLGINDAEIGGCLYRPQNVDDVSIILFDDVPGGAGHSKKIFGNFEEVLSSARDRVNGECGCSEDSSCYGCLRSYRNQYEHEILERGIVFDYLNELLRK
ncbi:MAG: DEAD/DEAH box helicase [Selenomonadaceae bacterium]|nr:DEAD/DEAH box helicase [Selenomonadaceae bacterium]